MAASFLPLGVIFLRLLMLFTIGFAIACALSSWALWSQILWIYALAALILGGSLRLLGKRLKNFWLPVIFLGCAVGFLWFGGFQQHSLIPILKMDGQTQEIQIRARDYGYETVYGSAFEGSVLQEGKAFKVIAYLDETPDVKPGDTLSGPFRFRVTTPGGEKDSTYHKGRGVFLLLYQEGELLHTAGSQWNWRDRIALFRGDIISILESLFPADTMPFAKALLIGDTSDLGYQTDSDLKLSGIRHVAAVSGLHVSILFGLVSLLTLNRRFLTAAVGFPMLVLFAALAGFTPSVTRACLMCGLTLLALVTDQTYDSATALSFAVLTMLVINPLVITDVGFQLSVGSVAGIYLFSGRIGKWIRSMPGKGRIKNWAAGSLTVSLSAMTITTPLSAYYFGTVSLIGIVTNLLTLWIITFIFCGILASVLLAFVCQSGAVILAGIVSWPIRYVLWIAGVLADFPLAAVYTRSIYIVLWLIVVYILLAVYLTGKIRKAGVLCCCVLLSLCLSLIPGRVEPWLDDVRFTVLDVGQGQCLLYQSKGKTILVDCGGDTDTIAADRVAQALLSQGITELDAMILTHWDSDHAGGAGELLTRVDTRLLVLPTEVPQEPLPAGETLYAREELNISWEGTKVRIFPAYYQENSNEKSLCVLFDTENCDILITGDRSDWGEQSLLRNFDIGKVDVLVAGHHGAKNSVGPELLKAVNPSFVCISVGRDNPFGHPAPETLRRLEEFGCQVYRTDLQGDIIIRR